MVRVPLTVPDDTNLPNESRATVWRVFPVGTPAVHGGEEVSDYISVVRKIGLTAWNIVVTMNITMNIVMKTSPKA